MRSSQVVLFALIAALLFAACGHGPTCYETLHSQNLVGGECSVDPPSDGTHSADLWIALLTCETTRCDPSCGNGCFGLVSCAQACPPDFDQCTAEEAACEADQ